MIKPCPFCGNNNKLQLIKLPPEYFSINCSECGASGPLADNQEMAIQVWNCRIFKFPIKEPENK